jgi:gliding motility-associated-like protein
VSLTNNLILTAPTGYEIATSVGGSYSNTVSLTPASGTISNTNIYVRLTSSAFNGASGNITAASISATTKIVATGVASVNTSLTASVTISSNATANTSCAGASVTFTATPVNGGTTPTYQWKVNGTNVGTNSVTYTTSSLSNNDIITVVMGSSIANCLSGSPATSNAITMTVNAVPNAPGSITGLTTICLNSNQVYSVAAVSGATAYTWVVTGNISATSTTNNVINITATNTSGSGTIKVLALNACGNSAYSATLSVTVNNTPAPTASFTTSASNVCLSNAGVTFTNTSSVNGNTLSPLTSYSWDFGDGSSIITTSNASNTYSTSGSYDAILTITDANACTSSVGNRIVVDPLSVPGTATAANATICYGSNTTINLTGNVGTVQWMSSPSGANNFTNINGATTNILNTGTLTSSTDYMAVVISGACTVATTSRITVTVSDIPSLTLGAVGSLNSNSTSFDLPYSNAVGNPYTYSVVATTPNSMPNFVPISNYGLLASPINIAIPATASGNYNFNLTLSNALGCSSAVIPFTISIAVLSPSGLSYTTPNVYTVGSTITALNPSSTGGAITSYTISPSLPGGLTIDPTTGIISGTPSVVSSQTSYIVTGANGSGTSTATVVITVNVAAPAGLIYTTPNVYTVGSTITALNPSSTGGAITSYTISPSLPGGLTIDPTTGVISGTPSAVSSQTSYTVTGTNASGTITATVVITVNVAAPASLSYTTPNVYTIGTTITALNPSSTGGAITSYTITPNLPGGLTIDPTTGIISGTPSAVSSQTSYTVSGTNISGTVTATVVITVNGLPPLSLSYTTPNVYTKGTAIASLNPTNTGGALTQYSIAPNLPSGLTINPSSGIISGTPTVASSQTSYVVTGFNAYGNVSTTVVITVNNSVQPPAPPPAFSGRYIQGNPSIPANLNALKPNMPTGVVPVWCTIGTLNCSTIAPTLPTAIGKYVYQVRTYDTANQLYSTTFVNDTIIIAPPAPVVKDSTYVLGILSNPSNVGVQVTGLTGATFNYFYLANPQTGTPALGSTIGTKRYTVSQTVNSIESDTSGINVTLLDPNSIIHLQKLVDTSVLQSNSTFNYQFRFIVTNLTNTPFNGVVIKDNLQNSVPLSSEFSIVSNSATGNLVSNNTFNGSTDINVTTAASALPPNGRDSAKFVMNLVPRGYNGNLTNIAYVSANTNWGIITMQSSAGSSSNPTIKTPTVYEVKDIYISIPEGFSPNHDGVNDNFVIIKPYNVTLDLEIFNRWGNVVYSNRNYNNDWDGRGTGNFVGQDLIEGGYYYAIKAVDDRGNMKLFKGYIIIQR